MGCWNLFYHTIFPSSGSKDIDKGRPKSRGQSLEYDDESILLGYKKFQDFGSPQPGGVQEYAQFQDLPVHRFPPQKRCATIIAKTKTNCMNLVHSPGARFCVVHTCPVGLCANAKGQYNMFCEKHLVAAGLLSNNESGGESRFPSRREQAMSRTLQTVSQDQDFGAEDAEDSLPHIDHQKIMQEASNRSWDSATFDPALFNIPLPSLPVSPKDAMTAGPKSSESQMIGVCHEGYSSLDECPNKRPVCNGTYQKLNNVRENHAEHSAPANRAGADGVDTTEGSSLRLVEDYTDPFQFTDSQVHAMEDRYSKFGTVLTENFYVNSGENVISA